MLKVALYPAAEQANCSCEGGKEGKRAETEARASTEGEILDKK